MRRPFPGDVENMPANLDEIFQRAVEGPYHHVAVEWATADVAVACTADTPATATATFSKAFAESPIVLVQLISANTSYATYINLAVTAITTTQATLTITTGSTQTITVRWVAIGRRE